jgi:hypothetical protein
MKPFCNPATTDNAAQKHSLGFYIWLQSFYAMQSDSLKSIGNAIMVSCEGNMAKKILKEEQS